MENSVTQHKVTARAPASIGNVAAGFDCLGQAFGAAFDLVTAQRCNGQTVASLGAVDGLVSILPKEVHRNTALRAAQAVLDKAGADFGARLDVYKGIPMSAGMGGSAASAVAGALAVNGLLPTPLCQDDLFICAMHGEAASADPPPPDNVAAVLYGGLVMIGEDGPRQITIIPLPKNLTCVLFHPALTVKTDEARTLLAADVPLATTVRQMRHMGGFIAGCFLNDPGLIAQNLRDGLIEPQRASLVPPFGAVKDAALTAGALGCSLSGSGPSIFAWVENHNLEVVKAAMASAFGAQNCAATAYVSPLSPCKAEIIIP